MSKRVQALIKAEGYSKKVLIEQSDLEWFS